MKIMKTRMFSLAVLFGAFISLSGEWALASELTKEYHEEYDANENTLLKLNNQYGNMDIRNWDDPKIRIDVTVKVEHSNDERAEKMLSYIDVKFTSSGNTVTAETVFDDKFSRSGTWKNGNDFEINYTVQMPAKIDLELYNKYGQVNIEEVAGHVNLELKYGKLLIDKLSRGNVKPLNTITLGYANGSSITECNWLKTSIKYSSLDIGRARAFVGYTSYMKLSIGEASSVVIEGKYDGYQFGALANLVINTAYSNIKAERLDKKLEADTKYTNVTVDYMPADFELINVTSKYGTYRIGIDDNASYQLEGEAGYSKIYYPETGRVSRIQENTSMEVSGTVGTDPNPSAKVKITTKYGNVKLKD
jgi:hypothetical protein